jgi:hypothetical protein
MTIAPLVLLTALLSGGSPARQAADAAAPRAVGVCLAREPEAAILPLLSIDPRREPFDPASLWAEHLRRERATEEEEEASPSSSLAACYVPGWRALSAPGLSVSGSLPLPGGKILPRLLPNLRC